MPPKSKNQKLWSADQDDHYVTEMHRDGTLRGGELGIILRLGIIRNAHTIHKKKWDELSKHTHKCADTHFYKYNTKIWWTTTLI